MSFKDLPIYIAALERDNQILTRKLAAFSHESKRHLNLLKRECSIIQAAIIRWERLDKQYDAKPKDTKPQATKKANRPRRQSNSQRLADGKQRRRPDGKYRRGDSGSQSRISLGGHSQNRNTQQSRTISGVSTLAGSGKTAIECKAGDRQKADVGGSSKRSATSITEDIGRTLGMLALRVRPNKKSSKPSLNLAGYDGRQIPDFNRRTWAQGDRNVHRKLSEALVREVRHTAATVSCAEWARRLGVSWTCVKHAREGRSWSNI